MNHVPQATRPRFRFLWLVTADESGQQATVKPYSNAGERRSMGSRGVSSDCFGNFNFFGCNFFREGEGAGSRGCPIEIYGSDCFAGGRCPVRWVFLVEVNF